MSALDRILQSYRAAAVTEREKGTYFERLALAYIKNDPVQTQQYSDAWSYADWAKEQGWTGKDTGIDLVAKLADGTGYAAIQCKFYSPKHRIQKGDIDGFLSASAKAPFVLRVFIDTTEVDWGQNAEETIANQSIPLIRIGLTALRESAIDWSVFEASQEIKLQAKKQLRQHQQQALDAVQAGFGEHDRGKLIMACGTGKTFTALKIAEKLAGKGKRVLFLVPSLALISQTVREWTNDTETDLRSFAVCSDAQVGKRRKSTNDVAEIDVHELEFPATTDAAKLVQKAGAEDAEKMTIVFSTYQSIPTITAAQEQGLPAFDLIICDEAHRTTGARLEDEEDSNFIRVHDNKYVNGAKRLYMTATPRIYGENARAKAADASVELCDMDDEALYGPTFFTRGFSWAVENGMLSDYKVVVLAMDEALVSRTVQTRLAADNELKLDDATKIIGCYKALLKQGGNDDFSVDANPMRRAIAFCKDIRSSKLIEREFGNVVNEFNGETVLEDDESDHMTCEVKHVDGGFNAKTRGELLHWLSDDVEGNSCKILSNARCLSEGVDVPTLDAIMFLHPRKSQIDVVQSVGRVMRKAEGKKLGYVILPVVIPANVSPEDALNDNERYKVVWQILNALRAHDDRFDATINKIELTNDTGGQIEVVAVAENLPQKHQGKDGVGIGDGGDDNGDEDAASGKRSTDQLNFIFDEFPAAIRAKIVQKCGRRTYWEDWAKDIGKIAQQHIERIKATLETGVEERALFDEFLTEIRDDLNGAVTDEEAIEMLAQHLITKPVFDALFDDYNFAAQNPVSQAMQQVVTALERHNIGKEAEALEGFYASVRRRASGINTAEGKQKIIVELYDKFFKTAFPKLTEKLGIVYTPVEVVDFIIHSVNDILKQEFGQTLGSKGVHILDPFTGTGTFITRLLQSGLIDAEQLEYKYKNEIHANEIVLLAYYIAAINIEATYHALSGGEYAPFNGICLTDTFEMYESEDMVAALMADNSERRTRQKALDIRVIVGNPPYSAGQDRINDNNANVSYPSLDQKIQNTYAAKINLSSVKNIYDSYIRAFRWATDRLSGNDGVISFISGNAWLDRSFAAGMRRELANDFTSVYVLNLRGDIRKNMMAGGKLEGENIFGSGSMTGICITILVRNKERLGSCEIKYFDVGEAKSKDEKLAILSGLCRQSAGRDVNSWGSLIPNEYHDWINQREQSFSTFLTIGDKKDKHAPSLFENYSLGVNTNRDAWCWNFSRHNIEKNMTATIDMFNSEVERFHTYGKAVAPERFVNTDMTKISWTSSLFPKFKNKNKASYEDGQIVTSFYRPFCKSNLFYDSTFNHRQGQMSRIYPNISAENTVICVTGVGSQRGYSVLLADSIADIHFQQNGQCFPLKLYEQVETDDADLFASEGVENGYRVKDGITDYGLKHFQDAYGNAEITKEDVFYYVYGLLHSDDYRTRFADNLSKELPRIPAVKQEADFWAFSVAGRKLGDLHVNYETVEKYPVTIVEGALELAVIDDPVSFYRVEKMKFAGKRPKLDKTTVHYNSKITMTDIPLEAYEYVVNGKSALDWVMERQCVKTDAKSGIVNDANDYANETMNNPAYPLELFQRVITVSLETMKIVRNLPKLEID
jgi:predicted helicase